MALGTDPYYARNIYKYQGESSNFTLTFDFDKEFQTLIVQINGDTLTENTDYSWLNDTTVQISATLEAGDTVSLIRYTPLDERAVIFNDGSVLDMDAQNISAEQVFAVVQEIWDSQYALTQSMQAYIDLKDEILDIKSRLDDIEKAEALLTETQELIDSITDTYSDMIERGVHGVPITVTHNLFEIAEFDKTLSDLEKEGWAAQNENIKAADYPTAYETILNEFNSGTLNTYADSDATTRYKLYTGSETGEFTIAENSTLQVGSTIYSDAYQLESIGEVTYLDSLTSYKYNIEDIGDVYLATAISKNKDIYSDALLTDDNKIGTITNVKDVSAKKYTLSSTGVVYTSLTLGNGVTLYSDKALSQYAGTITYYGTVNSDRYSIKGTDFDTFYVPKGTSIVEGTQLYSDPACTVLLAKIAKKSTISTSQAYCYKVTSSWTNVMGTSLYQLKTNTLFYTKTKLPTSTNNSLNIPIYSNSACTARSGMTVTLNNASTNRKLKKATVETSFKDGSDVLYGIRLITNYDGNYGTFSYCKLQSTIPAASATYYTIVGDTSETKCTIISQGSTSATVVQVTNGSNETFVDGDTNTYHFVKVDSGDWKNFTGGAAITNTTMKVDDGDLETVSDYTLEATDGVAFYYKEVTNGHKIVDSKYSAQITQYKTDNDGVNPYYVINLSDEKFTTPTLEPNKHLYFCVGNTPLIQADITGVTRAYLSSVLKDYARLDGYDLSEIYDLIGNFYGIVGDINALLTEVLGE